MNSLRKPALAVLRRAKDEYIRLEFDSVELRIIDYAEFTERTINVHELFCMSTIYPRLPISTCGLLGDHVSAVSWIYSMHSVNYFGHKINRALGLAETLFKFRMCASHLPGAINRMADAGSRMLSSSHSDVWSTLSSCWGQLQVPGQ
ncbi:hypothetical protein PHMEG_00013687 [Phytophthora megakarya]|uniref:Reverse transcriptase RNase H-like domain-containing protein n=1 Tax=Phytophthora megakarya TaxID=4795 RepID=A0A225W5P6_9STRA|nr:hypothetical protein PHMEG_00013687 [Phytophthora megakarya]